MPGVLTVRKDNLCGHIPSSCTPSATDGIFVTYKNAWCFSVFRLAWRAGIFDLSAIFF